MLKKKPEIDYDSDVDVLYSLDEQAVMAVKDSLKKPETLGYTILTYRELIANKIYVQAKEHLTIKIASQPKPRAESNAIVLL